MGEIRVYVLKTGVLPQDKSVLIAGLTQATESNRHPEPVWSLTPTYAVYIKHPDGNVLLDTSVNPRGMSERFPPSLKEMNNYVVGDDEQFPARLRQIGVKPSDIDYIVLSHLHFDHAGNVEMFPRAKVIVHEDEFTQTMKLFGMNKPNEMGVYVWEDLHQAILAHTDWKLFPGNVPKRELLPGLTIFNVGSGHSFGGLALLVELPRSGNILMVQDAIYTTINYGPPVRPPGIIYDSIGWAKGVETIKEIAKEYDAQIWFGHDEHQLKTIISSEDGYYE
jgi:glyoxylase-like metal-dependent hydrolase (beta-lactamase superfamily II)